MAQSDADKIVRAINALTAELKQHRPKRGRGQDLRPAPGRLQRAVGGLAVAGRPAPSLEDPDDSGYDCD